MKFIRHLRDLIRLIQLPNAHRKLIFYSEGKNYWPHLESLVREVLSSSDIPICYISSSEDDSGLYLEHPNYRTFIIDEGFIRNWLFENIEADVMVMTMPDLNQYQVKRSKHKVHYVYVQHSLVSLHMIYREGAFDHYDTIFCAGPHHVKEVRAMEARYNLSPKNLVEHGYGRLDAIIEESSKRQKKEDRSGVPGHVLIAPSWGPEGTIELGIAEKIVDQLMGQGYLVTLRPHPQTIKLAKDKIDEILKKHGNNPLFNYEANVAGQDSLHDSDIMISDWSGAALDYAFGLNKPVLFIDVPRKINNKNYENLGLVPLEVEVRSMLGGIIACDNTDNLENFFSRLVANGSIKVEQFEYVFNIGKSGAAGSLALRRICGEG
jgi:CDP-glycerol glycerophosphotransferase (TagB/SpsB family)